MKHDRDRQWGQQISCYYDFLPAQVRIGWHFDLAMEKDVKNEFVAFLFRDICSDDF